MTLTTTGLRFKSLFKLLFIGYLIPIWVFTIVVGCASYFGAHTINVNQGYVMGWKGLLYGIFFGPLFTLFAAFVNSVFIGLGVWVYTRFRYVSLSLKTTD